MSRSSCWIFVVILLTVCGLYPVIAQGTPPSAPTDLSIDLRYWQNSQQEITLSWSGDIPIGEFIIEKRVNGGAWYSVEHDLFYGMNGDYSYNMIMPEWIPVGNNPKIELRVKAYDSVNGESEPSNIVTYNDDDAPNVDGYIYGGLNRLFFRISHHDPFMQKYYITCTDGVNTYYDIHYQDYFYPSLCQSILGFQDVYSHVYSFRYRNEHSISIPVLFMIGANPGCLSWCLGSVDYNKIKFELLLQEGFGDAYGYILERCYENGNWEIVSYYYEDSLTYNMNEDAPAGTYSFRLRYIDNQNNVMSAPLNIITIEYDPDMDTDGDGMPNWWEEEYGFDPLTGNADADADGDGLSNYDEYLAGTDPNAVDTDGDGFSDGKKRLGIIDFESYYVDGFALKNEIAAFRGWVNGGGHQVALVEGAGEDGSCALYSDRSGATEALSMYMFTGYACCGETRPQPGHYYRMSFKGKGSGDTAMAIYWEWNSTLHENAEGEIEIHPGTSTSPDIFSLTEEWETYDSLVFIPEDHTFVDWELNRFQSYFKLNGDGVYYIDDITIEEIVPVYTIDFVNCEINEKSIVDEEQAYRCWVYNGAGLVDLVETGDDTAKLTCNRIGTDDLSLYVYTAIGSIGEMPPRPGRTYRMSFSARGDGDAQIGLYWNLNSSLHRTEDGGVIVEPRIWQPAEIFTLSADWETYSLITSIPEDDDNSFIQWNNAWDRFESLIKLYGGGSYEITDITLMEVIETTP